MLDDDNLRRLRRARDARREERPTGERWLTATIVLLFVSGISFCLSLSFYLGNPVGTGSLREATGGILLLLSFGTVLGGGATAVVYNGYK